MRLDDDGIDDDIDSHEAWCRTIITIMRDGGIWSIPRSSLVFRVDKGRQVLVLVAGDKTHEDVAATAANFARIGWGVETV